MRNELKKHLTTQTLSKISILAFSLLFGFLVTNQYYSYQNIYNSASDRDPSKSVFEEINLILQHNQKLQTEIEKLRAKVEDFSDQTKAVQALNTEISRSKKIAGLNNITGPGITITIGQKIEGVWFIDLWNELFSAGAEAISLNGIRFVSQDSGFLFSGENIIVNGVLIKPPYTISAIGEAHLLERILWQSGGILTRLKSLYPDLKIETIREEGIEMSKIF